MHNTSWTRLAVLALTVAMGLAPFAAVGTLSAQEQPATPPAEEPGRAPSHQPPAPAGALLVAGAPPAVGAPILQDSLTAPGAVLATPECDQTGRNSADFTPEGYRLMVNGRCHSEDPVAFLVTPQLPGLLVPDGEVRVQARLVSGQDRAMLTLLVRTRQDPWQAYSVEVRPAVGLARIVRQHPLEAEALASRTDLAGRLSRDDWNSVAVRLDGPNIWVLLNDELVLSASDSTTDHGAVGFGLIRAGDLDDLAESAVIFRDLRVSALARDR